MHTLPLKCYSFVTVLLFFCYFLKRFYAEKLVHKYYKRKKAKEKNLDMIIADISAAIDAEKSTIRIKIAVHEWLILSKASKAIIAKRIVFLIGSI